MPKFKKFPSLMGKRSINKTNSQIEICNDEFELNQSYEQLNEASHGSWELLPVAEKENSLINPSEYSKKILDNVPVRKKVKNNTTSENPSNLTNVRVDYQNEMLKLNDIFMSSQSKNDVTTVGESHKNPENLDEIIYRILTRKENMLSDNSETQQKSPFDDDLWSLQEMKLDDIDFEPIRKKIREKIKSDSFSNIDFMGVEKRNLIHNTDEVFIASQSTDDLFTAEGESRPRIPSNDDDLDKVIKKILTQKENRISGYSKSTMENDAWSLQEMTVEDINVAPVRKKIRGPKMLKSNLNYFNKVSVEIQNEVLNTNSVYPANNTTAITKESSTHGPSNDEGLEEINLEIFSPKKNEISNASNFQPSKEDFSVGRYFRDKHIEENDEFLENIDTWSEVQTPDHPHPLLASFISNNNLSTTEGLKENLINLDVFSHNERELNSKSGHLKEIELSKHEIISENSVESGSTCTTVIDNSPKDSPDNEERSSDEYCDLNPHELKLKAKRELALGVQNDYKRLYKSYVYNYALFPVNLSPI